MIERFIHACLAHRILVLAAASGLLLAGGWQLVERPVAVFPDLDRPLVTVIAEAPGLAPEEVETLVTRPLEAALAGAAGAEQIRSWSHDGLALVRVEFGWRTDLYRDRQVVAERLLLAGENLPAGVVPEMAPISSVTGQVLDLGLVSPDGTVDQLGLHDLAEWTVRRRLLAVPGVSQVVLIGRGRPQLKALLDPDLLLRHGVDLLQVARALAGASRNTSGGFLVQGDREQQVRNLGRIHDRADLARTVVAGERRRPVRLRDVGRAELAAAFARGAAAIDGQAGVVLSVFKQPAADTLELTAALEAEVEALRAELPAGAELRADLFRQATFLQRGVDNVVEALRDGALLVVIVLLVFLFHLRAALITLLALPLSFASAGLLFWAFDLTLNTMTLGGLAIAVGELVDDAIVGVENVIRRLRGARPPEIDQPTAGGPDWLSCQVAEASSEVRGPILAGTAVVVLVFLPLFALSGIEGRLFAPLSGAYVVALLASMVISLSVTPVLAVMLLGGRGLQRARQPLRPPPVLRGLQAAAGWLIGLALRRRRWVLAGSGLLVAATALGALRLGSQFLPAFDEGTVLVMVRAAPGTSLAESERLAAAAEGRLDGLDGVRSIHRYTGRGRHDEHAPPVTISHLMLNLDPEIGLSREQMLQRVRHRLRNLAGVVVTVGQPLAHRIDHLLTGVQAEIAVKLSGPELDQLRAAARRAAERMRRVAGVVDLAVEPQVLLPQLHVRLLHERLAELGLRPGAMAERLEIALGGKVVGRVLRGERVRDLFVRLQPAHRDSAEKLRRLPVRLPAGGWTRLGDVAAVGIGYGPNAIRRDGLQRRIAVACNAHGRPVGAVVADIRRALAPLRAGLPAGYALRVAGQFAAQRRATRLVAWLSLLSLAGMILILVGQFRSLNLALQVLTCVPVAFVGGVAALGIAGLPFSVAALVGFVSLAGIATRNGILLIAHALNLMRRGARPLEAELIIRAGRERAAPVVMTALTTGMGLLPLVLAAGEAGREILHPVAVVVVGGLLTSTLFEFLLRPALLWTLGRRAAERAVFADQSCPE